jgi:uncharacterized protein YwgA
MADKATLVRLNGLYKSVFGSDLAMLCFSDRIKVQKLVYILKSLGTDFDYGFNWYIRGPYSPRLARDAYALRDSNEEVNREPFLPSPQDKAALVKAKRIIGVLNNVKEAELLASYLFLRDIGAEDPKAELKARKAYFSSEDIDRVVSAFERAAG